MTKNTKHCGFIGIVGRPNVGKSTLLNHILGQKLSITSRKPQTTRHKVLGIKTTSDTQYIYIDTPGFHYGKNKAINRYMNRIVTTVIQDVDVIVFVVEKLNWLAEDGLVAKQLNRINSPIILVINKIDKIEDKTSFFPYVKRITSVLPIEEIIPISALQNKNINRLEDIIRLYLPINNYFYSKDQITNRSSRFLAAEIIREKITRQLGDELPYEVTVAIETFTQTSKILHIGALILVEKESQKGILIGDKGARLKKIGQQARQDMQILFGNKIMLKTWVKTKSGWSDDELTLRNFGYEYY